MAPTPEAAARETAPHDEASPDVATPDAATPDAATPDASALEAAGPTFAELGLAAPILQAVRDAGYERPDPDPGEAIPLLLRGRDIMGARADRDGEDVGVLRCDPDRLPRRAAAHGGCSC
jgi:hypothetical protein